MNNQNMAVANCGGIVNVHPGTICRTGATAMAALGLSIVDACSCLAPLSTSTDLRTDSVPEEADVLPP